MNWRIIAIGKPKLAYAREGIDEYAGRIRGFAQLQLDFPKAGRQEAESAALAERSEGMFRIVLDPRGEQVTSEQLAEKLAQWEQGRHKSIAVLLGGAEGHSDALRQSAGWLWSLGKLTLQHELALVVTLEQIYRAYAIKAGLPYHRA